MRGRSRGLTLVEVLIALVLLGLVSAFSVPSIVSSMRINADNRVRVQAVAAADAWLDRFRAKTLDFTFFSVPRSYNYGHDYGADTTFIAAGDPNPAALNAEWQTYKFQVSTSQFSSDPLIWRVEVVTFYHKVGGGEASFALDTLVKQ